MGNYMGIHMGNIFWGINMGNNIVVNFCIFWFILVPRGPQMVPRWSPDDSQRSQMVPRGPQKGYGGRTKGGRAKGGRAKRPSTKGASIIISYVYFHKHNSGGSTRKGLYSWLRTN